jgi:hypothetical protein
MTDVQLCSGNPVARYSRDNPCIYSLYSTATVFSGIILAILLLYWLTFIISCFVKSQENSNTYQTLSRLQMFGALSAAIWGFIIVSEFSISSLQVNSNGIIQTVN